MLLRFTFLNHPPKKQDELMASIFQAVQNRAKNLAYPDEYLAEEFLCDAMETIAKKRAHIPYNENEAIRYCVTVVNNCANDFWRKVNQVNFNDHQLKFVDDSNFWERYDTVDEEGDDKTIEAMSQLMPDIIAYVATLTDQLQLAFHIAVFKGLKGGEAAKALGVKTGSHFDQVRNRVVEKIDRKFGTRIRAIVLK